MIRKHTRGGRSSNPHLKTFKYNIQIKLYYKNPQMLHVLDLPIYERCYVSTQI